MMIMEPPIPKSTYVEAVQMMDTDMRAGRMNPESIFWLVLQNEAIIEKSPDAVELCQKQLRILKNNEEARNARRTR